MMIDQRLWAAIRHHREIRKVNVKSLSPHYRHTYQRRDISAIIGDRKDKVEAPGDNALRRALSACLGVRALCLYDPTNIMQGRQVYFILSHPWL